MVKFSDPKRLVRNGVASEFYYVRVREDGGRRTWRSTGARTKRDADAVVRKWESRDAKGELAVEDMAFDVAAETWLEAKKARVSPACATVYGVYVRHWAREFGARRLRALEAEDVERYFRNRKAAGLAPRSLNDERATLRAFLSWALDSGYLSRNPIARVEKFREEKRAIRALEPEEEERLLVEARKVGEDFYGSVLCLMRSGLRRGTVAALEWPDIDFARDEWRIPAAKMKSREDFLGRPIAPDLLAWLRERARPAGTIFGPLGAERWRTATRAAGLSEVRPHDVRRSFVTRARRIGIPMEVTMYLSDHRDLATVLACYRAVDPREARKAMDSLFGQGPAAAVGGGA